MVIPRHSDGTIFEHGPRMIRPAGPSGMNTLELVEEIGLGDKLVPLIKGVTVVILFVFNIDGGTRQNKLFVPCKFLQACVIFAS